VRRRGAGMPWRLFRFESETGNVGSRKGRSRKEELRSRKAEMLKWRRVGKQRKDAAGWPLLSPFFSAVVRQRNRLRQPPRRRILSEPPADINKPQIGRQSRG